VDATIVRSVLVPAAISLLGTRTWYMPRWLEWIPNVSIGEGEHVGAEPAGEPDIVRPLQQPVLAPVPVYVEEELPAYRPE